MEFALNDEQKLLKDSVDRFVERAYEFEARNKLLESDEGFSRDHWGTFAELGWLGVPFSEEQGGFGGGMAEAAVIMNGLGKGLVLEPFLPTVVLGGGLLARAGAGEDIERLVEGHLQLAFGFAEPRSRYNLAHVETSAEAAGDGFVLSGHKAVVFNAPAADKIVVSARTAGGVREAEGITLFVVDGSADGVTVRGYPTVDGLRAGEVMLDNVKVGADAILGEADNALPLIEQVIDRGIAAVCAEAAGIMEHMVWSTRDYLKTREQFGVPLSKFQVLQHRMADMFMDAEEALSMAYMAALRADDPDPVVRAHGVSAAKAFIGQAGRRVGQEAIQMHGGMGVTQEMPISHYFKRLTMIDTMFGNADFHLARVSDLMETPAAA